MTVTKLTRNEAFKIVEIFGKLLKQRGKMD